MTRRSNLLSCAGQIDTSASSAAAQKRASSNDGTVADPCAAFFRIKTATVAYGVSRSFIYRALAEGKIVAVKAGRSVLIDGNSLRGYLASLPRAIFKTP